MITKQTKTDTPGIFTNLSLCFFPWIGKAATPEPNKPTVETQTQLEQLKIAEKKTTKLPPLQKTIPRKEKDTPLAEDKLKKESDNPKLELCASPGLKKFQLEQKNPAHSFSLPTLSVERTVVPKIVISQNQIPYIVYRFGNFTGQPSQNRKILVVDAGKDEKQAFYQSTGTCSFSSGTWFPFDFLNANEKYFTLGWISKTDLNFEPSVAQQARAEVCGIFNQMLVTIGYPPLQPISDAMFGQIEINRFANKKFMEISARLGGGFWNTDYGKIIINQQNWGPKFVIARKATPLRHKWELRFIQAVQREPIPGESSSDFEMRQFEKSFNGHLLDINEWLIKQQFKIKARFYIFAFPKLIDHTVQKKSQQQEAHPQAGDQAPKLEHCFNR